MPYCCGGSMEVVSYRDQDEEHMQNKVSVDAEDR